MNTADGHSGDCKTEYVFNVTGADQDKIALIARETGTVVRFPKGGDTHLVVLCRDQGEVVDKDGHFRWVASLLHINSTQEALTKADIAFREDTNGNHTHNDHSMGEESPTEVTVIPQVSNRTDESAPVAYVEHLTEAIRHLGQGDVDDTSGLSDAEIAMRVAGNLGRQKDNGDW